MTGGWYKNWRERRSFGLCIVIITPPGVDMSALVEIVKSFFETLSQFSLYIWAAILLMGLSFCVQRFGRKLSWAWLDFLRTSLITMDLLAIAVAVGLLDPFAYHPDGTFFSYFLACDLIGVLLLSVFIAGATVVWVFRNEIRLSSLATVLTYNRIVAPDDRIF